MTGVASHVDKSQSSSGVKDTVTQYWIDLLIEKACQMRREYPAPTPDDIVQRLREWLVAQPGDKINPLLSVIGECLTIQYS
jgi:hypothetical protein